jgi:hypothetical protein
LDPSGEVCRYCKGELTAENRVKGKDTLRCKACSRERATVWRNKNRATVLLQNARGRARRENLPFNLTLADITIPEVCPVLGIPLRHGSKIQDNSPTLDRIIPNLGYTSGNVWVISNRANKLKSDASLAELEQITLALRERLAL